MDAQGPVEILAKRVERSRGFLALGAMLASGLALMILSAWVRDLLFTVLPGWVGLAVALAGVVGAVLLGVYWFRRVRVPGRLRASEAGLLWNGVPLAGLGAVREAIAYSNGSRHGVRVRGRRGASYFELPTRAEADRVVAALGKDSSQAAIRFGGEAVALAGFWWLTYQALVFLPPVTRLAASLTLVYAVPWVYMRLLGTRWIVGSDGLLVQRGLGEARFVRYAEIAHVEAKLSTLTATLRDGSALTLRSKVDARESSFPIVGVDALAARLEAARAKAAARMGGEDVVAELTRGERGEHGMRAWIEELRGLLDRPVGYRVAAVPRERLWSALEDVTQPAEVRAAAATALGPRLAPEERPRLRVAAAACASPDLRVAIEAAEESDDERLEEALKRLHAPGRG